MSWKFTLPLFVLMLLASLTLSAQTSCGDTFYDSGGPNGEYQNAESNTWTFCPDNPGDLVTLNFTLVDLETCCDDLLIYNGTGTGSLLNGDVETPMSFTSSAADGCLTVTWDSDGSVTADGWVASVSCAPAPPCPNPTLPIATMATTTGARLGWSQAGGLSSWDLEIVPVGTMATGTPTVTGVATNPYTWTGGESGTAYEFYVRGYCGTPGEFTNWVGPRAFATNPACGDTFYDSGGPNGEYQNSEVNTWTFCPDVLGEFVTLNFTAVAVESCCDVLRIYNGTGTAMLLNNDVEAPAPFTSTAPDGCLTVTWTSDGSVVRDGWVAGIACGPPPACPNPSALMINTVTSSGATLLWTENGTATAWDIEIVPLGTDATGTPTIVGVTTNPYTWTGGESGTTYNYYVRAQCGMDDETSNWVGPRSFTTVPGCGDSFFDPGGPNGTYANSIDETYTFCPDTPGEIVVIEFLTVDVEFCCDPIGVFNGVGTDDPLNLDVETPQGFVSTADNGCLTVTFRSDGSVALAGWEALISCTPCPPLFTENISTSNIGAVRADVLVETGVLNGTFTVEIGEEDFALGEGVVFNGAGNRLTLTGLQENTTYDYYVTYFCEDGTESTVLGPYTFTTIWKNNLGITGVLSPTDECGVAGSEPLRVAITNFGANPQTLFPLNFSVNGVLAGVSQPTDGFYTGIISRDSTRLFEFDTQYDFGNPGQYIIQVWTELMTDSELSNDTFTYILTNYAPPLFEDFESGVLPSYFSIPPFSANVAAPNAHTNPTFVLASNLFFAGDFFQLDFPVLSDIQATDTLFFDYRYVDWSAGTTATATSPGDILSVLVSLDCGETYEVVYAQTGDNHEPSLDFVTLAAPLGAYAGESIKLRILATYGGVGLDYWLDIDNINLPRCDGLGITAQIQDATEGQTNGRVTVTPASGIAPFSYAWNDGTTGNTRGDLAPGDYTVIVSDRFGCSDVLTVTVGTVTSTNELPEVFNTLTLAPNPTADAAMVRIDFNAPQDVQIDIVSMVGQHVWRSGLLTGVTRVQQPLDLSNLPAGLYLVNIRTADSMVSRKLMLTR